MTKDHVDVLQNIEAVLVAAWREHLEIDDRLTAMALKAAIDHTEPMDELAQIMVTGLENTRQFRSDVSEEIWTAGLQVVLKSVHTHSQSKPGEQNYLRFASRFV